MYAGPIVPSLCRELGRIIRLRPGALQPEKNRLQCCGQEMGMWGRVTHFVTDLSVGPGLTCLLNESPPCWELLLDCWHSLRVPPGWVGARPWQVSSLTSLSKPHLDSTGWCSLAVQVATIHKGWFQHCLLSCCACGIERTTIKKANGSGKPWWHQEHFGGLLPGTEEVKSQYSGARYENGDCPEEEKLIYSDFGQANCWFW